MDEVGTVRQDPDTKKTAIKTSLTADKAWFVFDVANGGHYTTGEREDVAEWPQLTA